MNDIYTGLIPLKLNSIKYDNIKIFNFSSRNALFEVRGWDFTSIMNKLENDNLTTKSKKAKTILT